MLVLLVYMAYRETVGCSLVRGANADTLLNAFGCAVVSYGSRWATDSAEQTSWRTALCDFQFVRSTGACL